MDIIEAWTRAQAIKQFRGDNEAHHQYTDEVAYALLALLCSGEDPDEVREVAEVVLEEEHVGQQGRGWWYA